MNNDFTTTELLIQYLDGELEGMQLDTVKKSIAEDAAIREEFEKLLLAKEAIKSYGLKSKVGYIHSEMMNELKDNGSSKKGIVRTMLFYSLRIAAIVVFVTGSFTFYQYFTATPEKLFSENFNAFALHETRGSSASTIEDAYKKGNMKDVIQQFNVLKESQPEDYFLAGNAFLSTHQPAKAIEAFEALQQKNKMSNTHFFEEDIEYYLALAYLNNKEPEKAIPLFVKINEDKNHPYHKKVSDWFLQKLRHVGH